MEAECCALPGHGLRPASLRRRARRPQLKRDPLGSPLVRASTIVTSRHCVLLLLAVPACTTQRPTPSADPPDVCDVRAWLVRNPQAFSTPLYTRDSLDRKLERLGPRATGPIHRPRGFLRGFEAEVRIVVVIDTAGRIVRTYPVETLITRTYAQGPEPLGLRRGFEQSAEDLIRPARFTQPQHNGRPVMVAACYPVQFVER
jgi:hypothetical protein